MRSSQDSQTSSGVRIREKRVGPVCFQVQRGLGPAASGVPVRKKGRNLAHEGALTVEIECDLYNYLLGKTRVNFEVFLELQLSSYLHFISCQFLNIC